MKRFAILFVILIVSSCAVFESKIVDLSQNPTASKPGPEDTVYFLPTGRVHLTIDAFDDRTVNIKQETNYIPDITKACFLHYKESALSYDKIQITLAGGTYLSAISSETEDNTPKIISDLGTVATNAIKLAAKVGAFGGGAAAPKNTLHIDAVIDPLSPVDVADLNEQLLRVGMHLKVTSDFDGDAQTLASAPDVPSMQPAGWGVVPKDGKNYAGLFYRPSLPYRLNFMSDPANAKGSTYGTAIAKGSCPAVGVVSLNVNLPNQAPIVEIRVSRAAFVKNSVKIDFDNGMFKDISYDKPSQVEGFVQIPVDLSKQALSVPDDLLTIRYANVTNQTTGLGDQAALLNAQANLIAAQQALKTAQQNAKPTAAPTPNGAPGAAANVGGVAGPVAPPPPGCPGKPGCPS